MKIREATLYNFVPGYKIYNAPISLDCNAVSNLMTKPMYKCIVANFLLFNDMKMKFYIQIFSEWDKQRKQAKENSEQPSFFKALVSVFGKQYVFLSIAVLFDECVIR